MAGAAFGDVVSPLSDSPVGVFAVVGMGAAFAGAARAPMTAVLIIVEMTGQFSLILPMMLAVVIATGASRFLTRATSTRRSCAGAVTCSTTRSGHAARHSRGLRVE